MGQTGQKHSTPSDMEAEHSYKDSAHEVYEPIADYCKATPPKMPSLFDIETVETNAEDIRVVELFAGVGGFRIGLERASELYKTVWSNQWEPSTKRQDASNLLNTPSPIVA